MKIKRYSVGGLHYVADLPSSNNTLPTQNNSGKKEGSSEIDKALLNIIKEHGLTNDVTYFTQAVNKMLSESSLADPFSSGTEYSMSQLLRVVDLANRVQRSNKEYETAVKRLQAEHAGNDIAVTNTGGLYVHHEGKVKTISAAEFSKNPDEYTPITTGDLLKIREYDPSLVYNTQILTDLSNQVGMKTIVDYIRTTINAFGKLEQSTDKVYNTKQMSDIEKGFAAMFGDHPIFKTTISDQAYTATATPEERQKQIAVAANYLWGTLNGNMKDVLQANAALNGRINKNSSPADILIQAINLHTDHSYKQDYQKQLDGAGSGSGPGSSTKVVKQTRPEMVAYGNVVLNENILIRSNDSKSGLNIYAQSFGRPMNDNEIIGMSTVRDLLQKDEAFQIVDMGSISMGDRMLTDIELGRVVYDGTSQLSRAVLPYDMSVYRTTGKYKVDFNILDAWEKFNQWLIDENPSSSNVVAAKLQDLGLRDKVKYDSETRQWKLANVHLFLMVNGYANDQYISGVNDSKWFEHVSKSEGDIIIDRYYDIINYGTDHPSKNATKRDNTSRTVWRRDGNRLWKSLIFMPVLDTGISTVVSNNELEPQSSYFNIRENRNNIQTNF